MKRKDGQKKHIEVLNLDNVSFSSNEYYKANQMMFKLLVKTINGNYVSSMNKILNARDRKQLLEYVIESTPCLNIGKHSVPERVYWIINDIHSFPICANPCCINKDKDGLPKNLDGLFKGFYKGYQRHCCNKCSQMNPLTTQSKKATSLKRHGNENYRNVKKARQTCLDHYGVENCMKSQLIKEKIKNSNQHKYGCDWYFQSEDYRTKNKKAICEKYSEDIDNVFQATEVKNCLKKTWLEKYGVDNPTKNQKIKDKVMQSYHETSIKRYGTYWPIQNNEVFKRCKRKIHFDNVSFDSFPELAFYVWLKDHDIKFEYQPNMSFKYECKGLMHTYYPDFLLVDTNEIIEIKTRSSFENKDINGKMICIFDRSLDDIAEAKHQCMLANNVTLLVEEDYMQYVDYFNKKYGKDFIFKLKDNLESK